MQVRTNNKPRNLINGFELTENERQEFDWMDWSDDGCGWYNCFFRYKGCVYATSEAMAAPHDKWHGIYTETAFSAVVFRFVSGNSQVVVGQIFS